MPSEIDAVLFDVGGTLRRTSKHSRAQRHAALLAMNTLLGTERSAEEWDETLTARALAYKRWSEETLDEATEEEIWVRWMLPEFSQDMIRSRALEFHQVWRRAVGAAQLEPGVKPVVEGLFRRGYRLGVVSNTTSRIETPELLTQEGIVGCFETIVLSATHGRRKPDSSIFLLAARAMDIDPSRCAYVGNRADTDVVGARRAGFGRAVLLGPPSSPAADPTDEQLMPDDRIDSLRDLLAIFPARYRTNRAKSRSVDALSPVRWQASLSTMWGTRQFARLEDFLLAASGMGFQAIELNHEVDTAMLAGVELSRFRFSSVHEPCPADVSTSRLTALDWLVSSDVEENRLQGVRMVKRSIHLAQDLGASLVIVHPGTAGGDRSMEKELRSLFGSGQAGSARYNDLRTQLIDHRRRVVERRLEATLRSMTELTAYAHREGILLGLENRYHYLDIPTPDEMGLLLGAAGAGEVGLVFDVGHAQAMEQLGFFGHADWLDRFATRIVAVHLHDVRGIEDHLAPGLGEVDFDRVAASLPESAIRTCELRPTNTSQQVTAGLEYLVQHGCVKAAG